MATSFVRGGKAANRILPPGTRPGLHGQILTSSGLADLDKILGGGLPLGTLIVVLEDSFAPHHLVLLRYFLAQGVQNRQSLFFTSPLPSPRSFLSTLPGVSESHGDKSGSKKPPEEVERSETQEKDDGLRIAWQYRRFISEKDALEARRQRQLAISDSMKSESESSSLVSDDTQPMKGPPLESSFSSFKPSGSSSLVKKQASETLGGSDFCSSFDMKKPIDRPTLGKLKAECFHMGMGGGNISMLQFRCSQFLSHFDRTRILGGEPMATTGRIAVQSLGAPSMKISAWEMLTWLYGLKRQLMNTQVVTFVTFPASLYPSSVSMRVQHLADSVISVESLRENDKSMEGMIADFPDVLGLLRVHKLPAVNTLVPSQMDSCAFAMKVVRRRKFVLEPLHPMPVDGVPEGGKSNNSKSNNGGNRSGSASALLCGGPQNAAKTLDF